MGATTIAQPQKTMEVDLNYWQDDSTNKVLVDFTKPEAKMIYKSWEDSRGPSKTKVTDVRGREKDFKLDVHGFEYVQDEVPALAECQTEEEISNLMLPATEELVKGITGASKVKTFTSRVRSKATDEAMGADNKAPALSVHSDFTPAGAWAKLESFLKDLPESERETLLQGRVCIINVWRPLKTIDRDPLAVCDWTTSSFDRDYVSQRIVLPHDWYELGAVKYSDQQKWYYLNGQTPSEPLVFKQFDSDLAEQGGQCVAHTAFSDPEFVNAPARQSIEIKMFAFIPKA